MVWFTADFHLGHSDIIRYCGRLFVSAVEMAEEILARVNESAKPEDELYFLVVFGNHDRVIRKIEDQFVWVKNIAEVSDNSRSCAATMPCASAKMAPFGRWRN